ncbi:4Fe-4S dicluster domain-containing protein [Bradyrhizobium hereditatis]|uniref:4Fe-4S dicluster domain-containing protein n=1 Tax=Bradyrhizobium hereditatis TaxID=2821405 RepID=UPI00289A4FF9|nr:4Fe-4S ferredoxin [Bradyrhizobium hereditatis]
MPLASYQTSVPVVVDDAKCIADKGCTVCVDVCPLDVLRISDACRLPTRRNAASRSLRSAIPAILRQSAISPA